MKQHSIALGVLIAFAASCLLGAATPTTKCARCGVEARCKKVCRLVCEEKKVEVVCWGCNCEDFCVPGPGCRTCDHCSCVCQTCGEGPSSGKVCSEPKRFFWYDWRPSFPEMYTKTKLMRRTEIVKVPTYKWVVENVCCDCELDRNCIAGVAAHSEPVLPATKQ